MTLFAILILLGFCHCLLKENLYVQPLEDGKTAFHFQFTQELEVKKNESGPHHFQDGFPRVIAQIVEEFDVKELSVTMTQGRWLFHRWSSVPFIVPSTLTGAQVWTIMRNS